MEKRKPIKKSSAEPVCIHEVARSDSFRMKYDTDFNSLDPATFFLFHNKQVPSHHVIRHLPAGNATVEEIKSVTS